MLARHERALRLEEILSVLHVQDGIAHIAAVVVRRKIDRQLARRVDVLEPAESGRAAAVLDPEDAAEGRAQGVPHFPHQRCISR